MTLTPEDLADCAVAFTDAASAQAALDAGVDVVLACALTPFGIRLPSVAPMVLDAAVQVPTDGDHYGGRNGLGAFEAAPSSYSGSPAEAGRSPALRPNLRRPAHPGPPRY